MQSWYAETWKMIWNKRLQYVVIGRLFVPHVGFFPPNVSSKHRQKLTKYPQTSAKNISQNLPKASQKHPQSPLKTSQTCPKDLQKMSRNL